MRCKEFDNGTALHIAAGNLCLEATKCLVSCDDQPHTCIAVSVHEAITVFCTKSKTIQKELANSACDF